MRNRLFQILALLCLSISSVLADDFTVERAVNMGQLDSWADISQFQWQVIDHVIQDNREEMDALINLFYEPAPKDTVGFYNQIYQARDNQYVVLRLDKAQGKRPFYVRVTTINSSTDATKNISKLFSADNYVYIMPPIGETQFEVKIWPQGMGEETAKSYLFYGHSYGSQSVRTVMLDKSRIIPGDYDLQTIYYNRETQKSDTCYINNMLVDKLYTFYDYKDGDLVEAYLRVDNFKRIKLKHETWARDAVTHINDNSIYVESGPQMPFGKHKRLDAPNPTYLDSRLFSHHDTLWVNLFLDNKPYNDITGLTMHAVLADKKNKPIGEKLLDWGKDPESERLYILTDGEPCTIECYRDGYLPALCLYPGSYDHDTGIISRESEEVDIFLQSIESPITSPTVTSAILSSLKPTTDFRGEFYVTEIQQADILPVVLAETVDYDEYASHLDTMKWVNGMICENYARLKVAIVSPTNKNDNTITLRKVINPAEKNEILKDTLDGYTDVVYSPLFDYSFWTTDFDLCNYLAIYTSGRPAVAFDGEIVRQLPILSNTFIDIDELEKGAREATKKHLEGDDAQKAGGDWITNVLPGGAPSLNVRIPLNPPLYIRFVLDMDFFRSKKLSMTFALGAGVFYDVISGKSNLSPQNKNDLAVTMSSSGELDTEVQDLSEAFNPKKDEDAAKGILKKSFNINAYAEAYTKYSLPLSLIRFRPTDWGQYLVGLDFVDETGLRAEVSVNAGMKLDFLEMVANLANTNGGGADWTKSLSKFYSGTVGKIFKQFISPLQMSIGAGVSVGVNTGIFSFYNTEGDIAPWKNHILAFKFNGQAFVKGQARAKLDIGIASAEAGVEVGAGISFKYATGCRLDLRNGFSGSAYSWFGGLGVYYKLKAFGWSKRGSKDLGRTAVKQYLIKPKNFKNPFHKNFVYYLSDSDDPSGTPNKNMRKTGATLPGEFVTSGVDFNEPVKFLAGGDSIVYQGSYENPNDYTVEVAPTGTPIYLSAWRLGGCTSYDAVSIPGLDLVLLEQATDKIAQEDLDDTLHVDETVKRASRVYGIYYTKKLPGTKWYSPQPVYSSPETTSFNPRVALADNGTGVGIWQEGLLEKGSWVNPDDTVQITDLVMHGQLMMSRYDGNETWSAPIPLMTLDESCALKDYHITYDGNTAYIIARKASNDKDNENICMTVDAAGNVTMHDIEQTDQLMRMRRIGDLNVLAWATPIDTIGSGTNFRVKSYGMDGKAKDGINTSIILNNVNVDDFRIVPDLEAQSLNNVALLWREIPMASDSTSMRLVAARLVPNKDGGFGIGTPMTTVQLPKSNNIFGFDGYMTNEKIRVCYVAVDSLGVSQLNKTVAYFGNAFNYTIQFDSENNQGFQCNADEITLLVTVNNYGTSDISECVLKIDGIDKQYPINTIIHAGSSVKQRITIPYILGTGVNTTMYVKYDDILGVQEQSYARYLARRAARIGGRKGSSNKEDHVYEQHTRKFYPYSPRFECFVAGQRVDKNGDNHITICVRSHNRRSLSGSFAIIVGLKEKSYSSLVYNNSGASHSNYETKVLFSHRIPVSQGNGYMHDYGSYRAGYVTITVPAVTEKEELYVGATLVCKDSETGQYMRLIPKTYSGSRNSGVVTLYPSSVPTSVENVHENGDEGTSMHVSRVGSTLIVTGVKSNQQIRLYQANGAIIARQQADESGRATFNAPVGSGVGLVSTDDETVKFVF